MAIRDGFIIPNASTYAPDYQTSQPDQGDFLLLGNSRFGVVSGCAVSLTELTASIGSGPNILVADDGIYIISENASVSLSGRGSDARFDLVVFSSSSGLTVVPGVPSANPVFPDITDTMVVLAAVFVPPAGGATNPHLIDKRVFLQPSLVGVNMSTVLRNYSTSGYAKLNINGAGKVSWGGGSASEDTFLERTSAATLKVTDSIEAKDFSATRSITLNGNDVVTTDRIDWGSSRPITADVGDVFIDSSSGELSIYRPGGWGNVESNIPTGAVIMSFASPTQMPGWLPLIGQNLPQGDVGSLWDMFPDWRIGMTMTLPDMRGRLPIGAGYLDAANPGIPGTVGGDRIDDKGSVQKTLTVREMPSHSHQGGETETGATGSHSHSGTTAPESDHQHTISSAGSHAHSVSQTPHTHGFADGRVVVATANGADTCLDIIFNDASHSHTTRPVDATAGGSANVVVLSSGSHSHSSEGAGRHNHAFDTGQSGTHAHSLPAHTAQGEGIPFTVRPPSLSMYFYIKI